MTKVQLELFKIRLGDEVKYARDRFILTKTNKLVFKYLQDITLWDSKMCILSSPTFSGKTHMGRVSADVNNGQYICCDCTTSLLNLIDVNANYYVLDGIEKRPDEELFHTINHLRFSGKYVLFTLSGAPENCFTLADLTSRLKSIYGFIINIPDCNLIRGILFKVLTDQDISIKRRELDYVAKHLDSTFAAVQQFSEALSSFVYREKAPITIATLKKVLEQTNKI